MVLRMRCCSHSFLLINFTQSHSNRSIPLQRRGRRERTILSISNVLLNKQNRLFAASASCKAPSASVSEPTPLKGYNFSLQWEWKGSEIFLLFILVSSKLMEPNKLKSAKIICLAQYSGGFSSVVDVLCSRWAKRRCSLIRCIYNGG